MTDSRRSSDSGRAPSEASTTVSEFVRKRVRGDVSVFGGNISNGLTDVASALTGSLATMQLTKSVTDLSLIVRGLMQQQAAAASQSASTKPSGGPIFMANLDDPIAEEFNAAAMLDDTKVKLLLDSSALQAQHVQQYFLLLRSAREACKKKRDAMANAALRKVAKTSDAPYVLDDELIYSDESLVEFMTKFALDGLAAPKDVARALSHESAYAGRETNGLLALVGDAALKMWVVTEGNDKRVPRGRISQMVSQTQSNEVFKAVAERDGLVPYIVVGVGVEKYTKKITSAVVEALFGAVYNSTGFTGMAKLNERLIVVEFDKYFG